MNHIIKFAALVILLLIMPVSTAISFEGPLQVKNQYPIFLHADQQYLEKAAMENSMSYSLSHSSTYTVQQSGEWTINLDMEITEINFRYRRIIKDLFEFNLDLPIIILGGGFMDGFLEDYHDTFGFSDYGRSERPHNDFLYEVKRNGNTIIDGKSGINIGDIRLAVKKPLLSSDNFTLSLRGDVEIPVSSAKEGYSNGSFDAGVSVLLDKRITDRIMTHFNLGYVFPGDVKGHERLDIKNFVHGGAAIDAVLSENWNFIIQVQGQSAIYPETDLRAVDRDAWLIAVGGRYQTETGTLEFSLTEDLSTAGAADFIINLTYKHYI